VLLVFHFDINIFPIVREILVSSPVVPFLSCGCSVGFDTIVFHKDGGIRHFTYVNCILQLAFDTFSGYLWNTNFIPFSKKVYFHP